MIGEGQGASEDIWPVRTTPPSAGWGPENGGRTCIRRRLIGPQLWRRRDGQRKREADRNPRWRPIGPHGCPIARPSCSAIGLRRPGAESRSPGRGRLGVGLACGCSRPVWKPQIGSASPEAAERNCCGRRGRRLRRAPPSRGSWGSPRPPQAVGGARRPRPAQGFPQPHVAHAESVGVFPERARWDEGVPSEV